MGMKGAPPELFALLQPGNRLCLIVAVALLIPLIISPAMRAGELGTLREDVRGDDSGSSSGGSSGAGHDSGSGHDGHFDDDCDNNFGLWVGLTELTGWVLTSPFWGPPAVVCDTYSEQGYFPHYPYENGTPGFMVGEWDAPTTGYSAHLRTRFEYAEDFDDLSRFGGRVLLEHTSRFGLDSSFDFHTEKLSAISTDNLSVGDVNVVFRFAQSDHLIMRTGLGVNWYDDDLGSDIGFNFTYGGDIFPIKPWVLSAELDWGTLGETGLFHTRGTIGVQLNRATIYTGYDFLNIGNAQVHGLVGGVELWF